MALQMLSRAHDEGVDDVVLTPHYGPDAGADRAELLQAEYTTFVEQASAIDVRLHLGAELGFRFGLADLVRSTAVARLAGGVYALIDLPPGPLSPGLEQAFFEVRTAGYRPILAHPERHRSLATDLHRLGQLRAQDLLLQLDAGSLRGRFGRRAQAAALSLIESGQADFVASDGHDLNKRPQSLRSAYDQVTELVGEDEAQRLFVRNPRRVLTGEAIEPGRLASHRPRPTGWRGWLRRW